MKRLVLLSALLFGAAGYVLLQISSPAPKLATLMPSGALLYLEAQDFGRLLRDWDASKVKADWLESANYAAFSRSNLFAKLGELYSQYGEAAGFLPDLKSVLQIAGTDSALALYEIRDVEFLYISRVADADLMKSQWWMGRNKFEQRQAGGESFYLRTDPASKRTVAFAFAKGHLIIATRDDLVAQSLELLAGGANPAIASDRWYRDAVAQAPNPGDLRMVLNLESLVRSVHFRSYWVQRNSGMLRRYWAGVVDAKRSAGSITESRVFLRAPGAEPVHASGSATLSALLALVPAEAGVYKASGIADSSAAASLIVNKVIGTPVQGPRDSREAPYAASPDSRAGGEADLETRIDEQPLPSDAGAADSVAAVRTMVAKAGAQALLLVQSSSPAAGTFVQLPAVIVVAGAADWNRDSVRTALTAAAGKLWTTSELGAGWVSATTGKHAIERLDGLGALMFAVRGPLLFLGNDARLLGTVLDRVGAPSSGGALTYAAGFRHSRERANYERVMTALDSISAPNGVSRGEVDRPPSFFSGDLASLGGVLSKLAEIRVTEEEKGAATMQTVLYRMEP